MPILLHQLGCCLIADATYSRNVVGRITNQRQIIGHEFGRNAKTYLCVLYTDPMLFDIGWPTAARVQEPDSRFYQLLEILITRYHYHIHTRLDTSRYEGADDVIGFEAGQR